MNRFPMMNRPQVPMNRPMTPMNRVASAPAATPGIAAILAQKANMQQPSAIPSNLSSLPMRQDVSSMGLGSLPQAGQAGMPAYANPYQQQQAQGALDNVMSGMQQGQPIPDWAKNYIAQPDQPMQQAQQVPMGMPFQAGDPMGGGFLQTGQLGSSPVMMPAHGLTQFTPEQLEKLRQPPPGQAQQAQQVPMQTASPLSGVMGGNQQPIGDLGMLKQYGYEKQPQTNMASNLNQMFNSMGGQQPTQQGGTPLQNNSSPLQQSAQPVMNPGVM
jgi:hypothetical protein